MRKATRASNRMVKAKQAKLSCFFSQPSASAYTSVIPSKEESDTESEAESRGSSSGRDHGASDLCPPTKQPKTVRYESVGRMRKSKHKSKHSQPVLATLGCANTSG